ncbi:MAG: phosphotransferase family protein [Candidatus Heimdallarchaeota archaeon]
MTKLSAADQIRKKQRIKELLADIVTNLKDYFDELQMKKFGGISRYVVLNRVDSIEMIGSKGLKLVKAEFNTDLGSLNLAIAIKNFQTYEEALNNKILTERLVERLRHTGILTPRVIFEYEKTLVYEGIQGKSFHDSSLDEMLKLTLAGDAIARFHTPELRPVDPERYVYLTKKVLKELKISTDSKNRLVEKGGALLERILRYSSGTAAFGDFHPGNLLFSEEREQYVQPWLIDPEYAEAARAADRFEDIGTFFVKAAIDHFLKDNNLQRFRENQIIPFIQGYDHFLNHYGLSMYEIYKANQEEALCFHLGLSTLLEALFIQRRVDLNNEIALKRYTGCIKTSLHIWDSGLN